MSSSDRPFSLHPRFAVLVLASAVAVVVAAVVGFGNPPSVASSLAPTPDAIVARAEPTTGGAPPRAAPGVGAGPALGADGSVPDGVAVFDDTVPAVVNLDADLLAAVRRAATDAAADDVTFVVNSGWRSAQYQDQLLRDAIAQYGSAQEAARWVATPETSPHVHGDAIDVGPWAATAWLSEHGARYGLCQVYANESWHYELRPDAVDRGCPAMYADPTQDPRMRG